MMKSIMNLFLIICAYLICIGSAQNYEPRINLYSVRYNTLDLDTILNSDRLVTNYVDCLLNRKPCSPEGKELKRLLPEALRTKCAKCSPQQKEGALKVLTKLYKYYPKHYNDLRARWDQTGEYHRRFMDYLREEKFNSISNDGGINVNYDKGQSTSPNKRDPTQISSSDNSLPLPSAQVFNQIPQSKPKPQPVAPVTMPTQSVAQQEPDFDIGNRFSEDDLSSSLQPAASAIPAAAIVPSDTTKMQLPNNRPSIIATNRPMPVATTTVPSVVRSTEKSQISTSTPSFVFRPSLFYIPASNQINGSPLIGIINRIGTKITTTADLIAEMLRGTVRVITSFNRI